MASINKDYNENLAQIDEKIIKLLKKREEITGKTAILPTKEYITSWGEKFDLDKDIISHIFLSLLFRLSQFPKPKGYLGEMQVGKSANKDGKLFTISTIKQYTNTSQVNVIIKKLNGEPIFDTEEEATYYMDINDEKYECRLSGGGMNKEEHYIQFNVYPALSEELKGLKFTLTEYKHSLSEEMPTGFKTIIPMD